MGKSYDFEGRIIKIVHWNKYNGRNDIKKCTWLRLENTIASSESLYGMDAAERFIFVELMCMASRKMTDTLKIRVSFIADRVGAKTAQVNNALTKLLENEVLELINPISTDLAEMSELADLALTQQDEQDKRTRQTDRHAESENLIHASVSLFSDDSTQEIISKIKPEVLDAWTKVYSDVDWVKQEVRKAILWMKSNPSKKPKSGYAKFMNGWLDRGWESYRKTLPSVQVKPPPSMATIAFEQKKKQVYAEIDDIEPSEDNPEKVRAIIAAAMKNAGGAA